MEVNEEFISLREYKDNEMAIAVLCDAGVKKKIPIYVISSNTSNLIPLTPFQINEIICAYPKFVKTKLEENNGSDSLTEEQELSCIKLWVKKADAEMIFQKPVLKQDITTRERKSMLKLILGMAIKGYNYLPYFESPQTATGTNRGSIFADLHDLNISLGDDTIRKYLEQAECELNRDLQLKKELLPA